MALIFITLYRPQCRTKNEPGTDPPSQLDDLSEHMSFAYDDAPTVTSTSKWAPRGARTCIVSTVTNSLLALVAQARRLRIVQFQMRFAKASLFSLLPDLLRALALL